MQALFGIDPTQGQLIGDAGTPRLPRRPAGGGSRARRRRAADAGSDRPEHPEPHGPRAGNLARAIAAHRSKCLIA